MMSKLLAATIMVLSSMHCMSQGLAYEDSIHALAYGNVEANEISSGTVWLNISGFGKNELPFIQNDLGVHSLDNFEPLMILAGLAQSAASKGQYGDLVFLYNAFAMNAFPGYVKVSSQQMQESIFAAVAGSSSTPDDDLIDLYAKTSSSPDLAKAFMDIKTSNFAALDKRYTKETCSQAHQALKSACQSLIQSISGDVSVKSGSPRSICAYGCCISWSANATFQYRDLTNAANSCISFCQTTEISCEVYGVNLSGTILDQCLSNRADGCS